MSKTNERQRDLRNRMGATFFVQQLVSLVAGVAVFSIPLSIFVAARQYIPTALALVVFAAPVALIWGVWALVDGTADYTDRRNVRIGAWASSLMLLLAPLSLYIPPESYSQLSRVETTFWIVVGVVVCLGYHLYARRYWRRTQSVT